MFVFGCETVLLVPTPRIVCKTLLLFANSFMVNIGVSQGGVSSPSEDINSYTNIN